uniref:Sushi domain-containing protein n=1 Tax=Magallana gigas TaxID=29159 RepID=A0A8W8NYD3_MAGGI
MPPLNDILRFNLKICLVFPISRCFADLRHGYSMLQYGHKLERRMISSYDKYSILDCVEDCLRTTRCRSVNYHQGAHFCQTNFKTNVSTPAQYIEKPGWIYSNIEDWDRDIAGACSTSNCALNEKCIPKPFGEHDCVLSDCGIPSNEGFSMGEIQEWDAIGITRRIHIRCALGYNQQGSEVFVCRSNGSWRTDLNCTLKTCPVGYTEATSNVTKTCLRFVDTPTLYPNATLDCKKDGGDLIKLDTEPLKNIFLKFIDGYIDTTTNNNIWIQAEEDGEGKETESWCTRVLLYQDKANTGKQGKQISIQTFWFQMSCTSFAWYVVVGMPGSLRTQL